MALYSIKNGEAIKLAGSALSGELVYGASTVRTGVYEGTQSISAESSAVATITFSTPMPDADYLVILDGSTSTAMSHDMIMTVQNKTKNGFTVVGYNEHSSAQALKFNYTAFKLFTVEGLSQLEEDVAELQEKVKTPKEWTLATTITAAGDYAIPSKEEKPEIMVCIEYSDSRGRKQFYYDRRLARASFSVNFSLQAASNYTYKAEGYETGEGSNTQMRVTTYSDVTNIKIYVR